MSVWSSCKENSIVGKGNSMYRAERFEGTYHVWGTYYRSGAMRCQLWPEKGVGVRIAVPSF